MTFPQGKMLGGYIYYPTSTLPQQFQAFYEFNANPNYDEYATVIQSVGYSVESGQIVVTNLEYSKPVERPTVFEPFLDIMPQLLSTERVTNLTNITIEQGSFSPPGLRCVLHSLLLQRTASVFE